MNTAVSEIKAQLAEVTTAKAEAEQQLSSATLEMQKEKEAKEKALEQVEAYVTNFVETMFGSL